MFEDIQIKVSHPLVSDEHNEKNMKVSLQKKRTIPSEDLSNLPYETTSSSYPPYVLSWVGCSAITVFPRLRIAYPSIQSPLPNFFLFLFFFLIITLMSLCSQSIQVQGDKRISFCFLWYVCIFSTNESKFSNDYNENNNV